MQQAEELKELTRLIRMAEAQTNALKEEKKELDAELQKTCDQRMFCVWVCVLAWYSRKVASP